MTAAPGGFFTQGDLLPDLGSSLTIFNLGEYERMGFIATLTQPLGELHSVTFAYGIGGVLEPGVSQLETGDAKELRSSIEVNRRNWLAARYTGLSPRTGTRFSASQRPTD